VRSSTSNSDPLEPGANGVRTWALALTLFAAAVIGWETHWRTRGLEPSFGRDQEIWLQQRTTLAADGIALVGSSRVRSGVEPVLLASLLDRPVTQLGINGSSSLPVLENIAEDEGFRGTVVADVFPPKFFDAKRRGEIAAELFVNAYTKGRSPFDIAEAALGREVDARLASHHSAIGLMPILSSLRSRTPLRTPYYRGEETGFLRQDFRGEEVVVWGEGTPFMPVESPLDSRGVMRLVWRTEAAIQKIQRRGGDVILLRFPSTRVFLQHEQNYFPREQYWDAIVRGTSALTVHFEDEPAIARLIPPDGSHLDYRDATRMTRFVAELIQTRQRTTRLR
jgi:hypothetical protein